MLAALLSSFAWPGLAWLGLAWPGLAWLGLAWLGLACQGPESASAGRGGAPAAAQETLAAEAGEGLDPRVAERIGDRFGSLVERRHPPGQAGTVKRAVFLKPHGCVRGQFQVAGDLPARLRQGLFAKPARHEAWLRISSDTVPATSDFANSTVGFAVKVLGVPGRKVLPGEESAGTQDFVLQNHPVFFVDTAEDFLDFTEAIFDGTLQSYLAAHPGTAAILEEMSRPVGNVLGERYFSTTPYRLGTADHVKYSARPCTGRPPEPPPATGEPDYLRDRLLRDIATGGACYELQVQLRADDGMPLDRATVLWSEERSAPVTVATLTIPPQDVRAHDERCEHLSFTAWHALPAHRPVGSVNEARGVVYKRLADVRRRRNGVALEEPR